MTETGKNTKKSKAQKFETVLERTFKALLVLFLPSVNVKKEKSN